MLKIDFENQILAFFDVYFWPFNKSHEKIRITKLGPAEAQEWVTSVTEKKEYESTTITANSKKLTFDVENSQ